MMCNMTVLVQELLLILQIISKLNGSIASVFFILFSASEMVDSTFLFAVFAEDRAIALPLSESLL